MIRYTTGDILQSDVEALVNTVNCVGVMGRGIALQFKNSYPDNFIQYKQACEAHEVVPGKMLVYETGLLTYPKYIINFPTKRHWKGKSRLEDIESGLDALVADIKRLHIYSIAIPPLGSGLGGLPWGVVKDLIQQKLSSLPNVEIAIYEPSDLKISTKSVNIPQMTPSRAAIIKLVDRYLASLMDPFVSLLEVQKLMYFMQECGEPLRLNYEKGPYGPYAPNLRHVLRSLEGYYISGYGDGGDDPKKPLSLVPGAVSDADAFLGDDNSTTKQNLEKVFALVEGFETSFGLELLATVHWILVDDTSITDDALVEGVHAWSARKKRFTPHQILIARHRLQRAV